MMSSKSSLIAAVILASVTASADAYLFNGKAPDVQISKGLMDKVAFTSADELKARPNRPAFGLEKVAVPTTVSVEASNILTMDASVVNAEELAAVEGEPTTAVDSKTEAMDGESAPDASADATVAVAPQESTPEVMVAQQASEPSQGDAVVEDAVASASPEMSEESGSTNMLASSGINGEPAADVADMVASTSPETSEESASKVTDMLTSAVTPETTGSEESVSSTVSTMVVNVADMVAETVQQASDVIGAAAETIQQAADVASALM
jgi:hypothetical protein